MRRLSSNRPFTCATCEIPIHGTPVIHVGLAFCCAGCVAGGPCTCSYDEDLTDDHPAHAEAADHPLAVADDERGLVPARR